MRPQEQIASHTHTVRRSSANNGLPYRQQQQLYEQEADEYEDDVWPPPVPRSAIRYTTEQPVVVAGNRRYVLHNRLPQPIQQSIPQPRPPSRPQPQLQPRPQPRPQLQAPPQYEDEAD